MVCSNISYSDHAVSQMFKRDISTLDVRSIMENGEIITVYLHDKPFPSYLMLGYINKRPIHIVVAKDNKLCNCIVVTAYEPDAEIWELGFKNKK